MSVARARRELARMIALERRPRLASKRRGIPRTILDFIPWANPGWIAPHHLGVMATDIEQAFGGAGIERFYTVPPRHAKSETVLNGIAWGLAHHPNTPVLYASHTATFAYKQSRRIKRLAMAAGVQLAHGSNRVDEWETIQGGGVVARGVGGEITGRGFKVIVIDDPIKSRALAEVATYRERVYQWLRDDVFTRGTPDASYLVVHTRWHPDDPIGRLIKDGWIGTVLRAISEGEDPLGRAVGEALAPDLGWTATKLEGRRRLVGEYGWASLFQGRPRPRGGKVFSRDPSFFSEKPTVFRRAYGVDLAYTAKTQADHSVLVDMWRADRERLAPLFYVWWVLSIQCQAPEFAKKLRIRQKHAPADMLFMHGGGGEKGSGDFIDLDVPRFIMEQVHSDKFVRAQPFAAAWNDGRVLLPDPEVFDVPWLSDFLDVLDSFTGVKDKHDDEVDAAAAAHRLLDGPGPGGIEAYT